MPTAQQMARWTRPDGTIDQHATHHHKTGYGMSCEQFDALLRRSGEACEICGRSGIKLHIDHEHASWGAGCVRGLLCAKCNVRLGHIDIATQEPTSEINAYYRLSGRRTPSDAARHHHAQRLAAGRSIDEAWEDVLSATARVIADSTIRAGWRPAFDPDVAKYRCALRYREEGR